MGDESEECKNRSSETLEEEFEGQFRIKYDWLPRISPKYKRWISVLFIMAVIAEASFLLITDIKIFRRKSAKDFSLIAAIVLVVTNVIWIGMALFVLLDWGVLISGVLYVGFGTAMIVGILMYGDTNNENEG
jgi:hypothetical protein